MSPFYKRKRVPDKRINFQSRILYIDTIAKRLRCTPQLFPRPDQERLYQKALAHVVQVLSAETLTSSVSGNVLSNEDASCNNERAQIMKDILNRLQRMERGRLYDPPSDYEYGYYLLAKKYSRPMYIFHESQSWASNLCGANKLDWYPYRRGLSCFSPFSALHFVEEMGEVNKHMEHISANLSEMDIQNGHLIKLLLGINTKEKDEMPPLVCGSKERSNMFYYHKFMLALMDLRSSLHAFSPPLPEEKECFEQVLLHIEPHSSNSVKDEVDVYCHHLRDQFMEWLIRDTVRFEDDCMRITQEILKKVPIHINQEEFRDILLSYYNNAKEKDEKIVNCYSKMVEKCNISCNDLPDYIVNVSQTIEIMAYILHLNGSLLTLSIAVEELLTTISDGSLSHDDSYYGKKQLKNIGWEVLHALTLFRHGSSFPVMEFAKKNALRDCFNQGKKEPEVEDLNGNVETLKDILEFFRRVGDWDLQTPPTYGECQVVRQIWRSLVCSIHFFNCTMAYEQATGRIKIGQNNAARRKTQKWKRGVNGPFKVRLSYSFSNTLGQMNGRINVFIFILQGFRDGLMGKLKKLQK